MDGLVEECSWPFPSASQNSPSRPNIFTSSYVYLVPAIRQKLPCPQSVQKRMRLLMWLGSAPALRATHGDWVAGRQLMAELGATSGRKCLYWREKFALFIYLCILIWCAKMPLSTLTVIKFTIPIGLFCEWCQCRYWQGARKTILFQHTKWTYVSCWRSSTVVGVHSPPTWNAIIPVKWHLKMC